MMSIFLGEQAADPGFGCLVAAFADAKVAVLAVFIDQHQSRPRTHAEPVPQL